MHNFPRERLPPPCLPRAVKVQPLGERGHSFPKISPTTLKAIQLQPSIFTGFRSKRGIKLGAASVSP